jgi:hypothetical protein
MSKNSKNKKRDPEEEAEYRMTYEHFKEMTTPEGEHEPEDSY